MRNRRRCPRWGSAEADRLDDAYRGSGPIEQGAGVRHYNDYNLSGNKGVSPLLALC